MSKLPRPKTAGPAWTSFVAAPPDAEHPDKPVRSLHESGNPNHRLRVEHNPTTLLLHLSGEDGPGWTTIAVDRATRQWAVGQGRRQSEATAAAYDGLYES